MASLVTNEDFATATGLTVDDDRLTLLLAQASEAVRSFCGWEITGDANDVELTLDGPGSRLLRLPTLYVRDVVSIVEDGTALTFGADYQWSTSGAVRREGGCWTSKYRSVVVTAKVGYTATPADVAQVVMELARRSVAAPSAGATSSTQSIGPATITTSYGSEASTALLGSEKEALSRYQIRVFA